MGRMADTKLIALASALISVGALCACGDDANDAETITYSDEVTGDVMPEPVLAAREQCYGVALAQQNDCATKKLTDCVGTADKDYLPDKWQYVPAGECEGRVASLEAKKREDGED